MRFKRGLFGPVTGLGWRIDDAGEFFLCPAQEAHSRDLAKAPPAQAQRGRLENGLHAREAAPLRCGRPRIVSDGIPTDLGRFMTPVSTDRQIHKPSPRSARFIRSSGLSGLNILDFVKFSTPGSFLTSEEDRAETVRRALNAPSCGHDEALD